MLSVFVYYFNGYLLSGDKLKLEFREDNSLDDFDSF